MGGKSKQSQRTKNNVRPSSSSRSAEHLNGGISLDGGIMSLAAGKPLPPLFPTLAAANLEQGLNPEFQMCIKKLNKKDPITRAKALHELCELVNNGDVEDVVAALPSWAHFYKILTMDTDRKVREMTQVCHGAIVRVCGRRTAPQLKALLPAWLQAQYDDHAPAQTHAQHSLTSTFPDSKLPEVISFCKAEVMAHLLDNLNGNTAAIATKRIEDAEERQLLVNRIATSSLQGLQYLCLHLPRAHDAWLWEQLLPLLQAAPYWKLAHASPQLRAAWCGATGRVLERFPAASAAPAAARTLRVLLDTTRGADAAPWQCLLQLMHHVPNWHLYLDKKELLVKRILDVLENGGWGDAKHLSNMLLPLLAYLPQDILTKDFYEAFFNAVFAGLEKKNILNSKSERQAWILSLSECLRYLSIQQNEFVPEVVTSVHRTWLTNVLAMTHDGQTRTNLIKCSATNMAALVKYWLKQSKAENSEKYDQLVRNFWQNVGSTVLTQIDKSGTDHNEIGKLIDGHILLLQTLKSTFSQEVKKQHSIKFDGDEQTVPEQSAVVPQPCDDASIVERYRHNLEDVVHKICSHYLDSAEKRQLSSTIVTPLITLLVEFDSKQLFSALARQFDVDSVHKLYDKVLRRWLSGDTMRCKAVADVVFLLMKYMSEEEQDAMFDTFQQFPPAVVEWCLSLCVRHPHVRARAVRRWLRGEVVRGALRGLAERARGSAGAAALLCACLTTGELLVSEASISDVIASVSSAVELSAGEAQSDSALESRAGLAARLLTSLPSAGAAGVGGLLLQLFRLNVRVPRGDSRLSVDTWCEVRSSWQDGAVALPAEDRTMFLTRVVAFLHEQLFTQATEHLDITKIENTVSLCPHLFNKCDAAEAPDDVTDIVAFTKQIFDMTEPDNHVIESFALRHECVTSQLNCLYDDDSDVIASVVRDAARHDLKELTKTDLLLYVNKHLFRAIYLRSLLLHRVNSDDDEDEPSEQRTWCNVLLKDEYVQREWCNVMHAYVVINCLHEGYAFWPHYDIIVQTKQKLDSLLADVISATSEDVRSDVKSRVSELALAKGYLWALAQRWHSLRATGGDEKGLLEGHKLEDIVSGNGFFHTLQASTKWGTDSETTYNIKYLVMLRSWYIAYGDRGDEDLVRDVTRCRDCCDIDVVVNDYYKRNHTMLYDKNISDCSWSEVVSNVAVVEFLSAMVTSRGWDAPAHHWDFATITLCSLLASVRKSMDSWGSTKVSMLSRAVLRLWVSVHSFVSSVPAESHRRQPAPHVADLVTEWKDIFHPDTSYNLFSVLMHVLDSCNESEMTSTQIRVLGELLTCTKLMDWDVLADAHKRDALSLSRLASVARDALRRPAHHAHARLAHCLLHTLAKPLVLEDAEKLNLWSADSQDAAPQQPRPQFCLELLHDTFSHLRELLRAALAGVQLGEGTCEIVAMSDTYNMALGWLLLADVLATLCQLAHGDLIHHYIQIYRERGYAEPLLTSCLRLLPHALFAYAAEHAQPAASAPPAYADCFLHLQHYSVHEPAQGSDICALACRCLYRTVCGPGTGGARGWWGAAPARHARLLERVVTAYVAPPAAREQLLHLHKHAHEIEDAEVRIAWSSLEVSCVFNVEERAVELRVWLARAHPLAAPRLAAPRAGPGVSTHWVALYLAYQNGTLLNALKMWTRAVSSRVESSPQCYICYCRLHPNDGRLPRVLCYQCKNKFHTVCLRKWFTTSNKSNCPLCRAAF